MPSEFFYLSSKTERFCTVNCYPLSLFLLIFVLQKVQTQHIDKLTKCRGSTTVYKEYYRILSSTDIKFSGLANDAIFLCSISELIH